MNIELMVDKLVRRAELLYYRRWESWELLALGLAAILVIVLAIRSHRKAAQTEKHLHERTPDERLQKLRDL